MNHSAFNRHQFNSVMGSSVCTIQPYLMDFPEFMSFLEENEDLSFENLSRLVTSPDLLSHLQELDAGGEKIVSSQWLGPHLLSFLKYAIELLQCLHPASGIPFNIRDLRDLRDLLKRLDDSASVCILDGETEHYKNFLEIILSFMPELDKFFKIQTRMFDNVDSPKINLFWEIFIDFLFETIGELLLKCPTDSGILVSNQVKFLAKELNFLLAFLVDPLLSSPYEENQYNNIYTEIKDVFHSAGLLLHYFFFTTDLVTVTKMDLAIFDLLERIETVQVKIKYHCISVLFEVETGSLQVAERPSAQVSSSQDESISMVKEIIVGLEDMTTQIASKLVGGPKYRQIVSIIGMGGLGKTTLAKKVYNLENVQYHFDTCSWCVVSQTYNKRKLFIDILSSVSDLDRDEMSKMKYDKLAERLYQSLKGRRYFIFMDDVWDKQGWDDLQRLFPEDRNGSRILLTSRLKNLALEISHVIIEPPPLSPDESWNLLEQKVFKKEHCPIELQEIGQQIARNCHGLPLSIIIIAGLLSNMEKKQSLWQQVAKSLTSYISQNADNYIPTLELSYKHLPDPLKPCFLYLSAFQEDEGIPVRKLLLLWIAEGFIEKKEHKTLEDVAEEYLMELVNRSLLQVYERRSDNGVKTCTLHDLILDMCRKLVLEDEKFLYQHQFLVSECLRRSHHLLISKNLSEAFSIVYSSEKIRILDSRYNQSVRLGIKIMPDLRYLEASSLVPSISRLHNLEFLLLESGDIEESRDDMPAYLLNMPKLRHLHFISSFGARFSKNCDKSRKNNLQTLCYVNIDDPKDEEILRCSPNLRTLKCKCQSHNFCPGLNSLTKLESLKMAYGSRFKGDYSVINFPRIIKKLTLSKIGLPWEKMSLIGTLPNLEILKLEDKAFEGEIWDTKDDEFQKLKFLKLYILDLQQWNSSYDHFPILERLVLLYCRNLEMIPLDFSNIPTLQKIRIHRCGKNIGSSAIEILKEQRENGNEEFEVTIIN